MNAGEVLLHTNALYQNGIRQQVIKDGSKVLVRVIADRGDGKYEGSVAGSKVNLLSQKPLVPGSSFTATVSVKNGIINISPDSAEMVKNNGISANIILTEIAGQNGQLMEIVSDSAAANYLRSLGLVPDNLSLNLVQQLKQMEMKYNPQLLKRIRNLSISFAGKEKKASEILMTLAEKEIPFTEEELLALLSVLDDYSDGKNQNKEEEYKLLNKINEKKGRWYFLPFEIENLESFELMGSGVIRFLMSKTNKLKQLNLKCSYNERNYLFALEFSSGKCSCVKMNVSKKGEECPDALEKVKRLFMNTNSRLKVLWEDFSLLEGNAPEITENSIVRGFV